MNSSAAIRLILGSALAAFALNVSRAASPAAEPPKVTVAPVEERIVTEYGELLGRVEATETVELRARVSGHLAAVRFRSGELVKHGDILFTIDPRWHRARFDLARASLEQARARGTVAEREAKRAADLLAAAAISSEEADARTSRAIEACAAVTSAEAAPAGRRVKEGAAVVVELNALGAEALFVRTDVTREAELLVDGGYTAR